MVGFIALSIFLSNLKYCNGTVCTAARVDAVFGAFAYVCWASSATITGIEISRTNKKDDKTVIDEEKAEKPAM